MLSESVIKTVCRRLAPLGLALLLLQCGCETDAARTLRQSQEVDTANAKELAGPGTAVGTFSDGRKLRAYTIRRVDAHPHTVYVVDDAWTVTTNRTETYGKGQTRNRAEAIVSP